MKFRSSVVLRCSLPACFVMGAVVLSACDSGKTSEETATAGAGNVAGAKSTAGAANTAGTSSGAGASAVGGAGNGAAGSAVAGAGGALASAGTSSSTAGAGGSVASGGACAGALICEDFESYTTQPTAPWKVDSNSGSAVAIDSTKHVSGSKSVKFTTDGVNTYQRAYIGLTTPTFPIAGNAFYGRMMLYVTKAANDGVHWSMIQAEGPVAAQGVTSAKVRYGGQTMQGLMANYDSEGKASDCWQHSATKIPEGKWACMQWYFDGKSNTQKFWLDSVAIDDLTVVGTGQGCINHDLNDTWYFPQDFTTAYVGWESYQKDDPREVWIDDFALGTAPIACPAAP